MNIVIKVDTEPGEESTWLTWITPEELNIVRPLILEIQKNNGYFPTGNFLKDSDPKPDILYSGFPGWSILKSRLPTPVSGIKKILEIHIFEEPISLYL